MQSIGSPSARANNWNALADQMVRLGANRYVLNALDGSSDSYALVGRPGAGAPAAESSTATGEDGALNGVTSPDRTLQLTAVAADPFGELNTELVDVAYQRAQPFPAFTGGAKAAETWIGIRLGFCKTGAEQLRDAPPLLRELRLRELDAEVDRPRQSDLARATAAASARPSSERSRRSSTRRSPRSPTSSTGSRPCRRRSTAPPARASSTSTTSPTRLRGEVAAPTGDATTSWALGLRQRDRRRRRRGRERRLGRAERDVGRLLARLLPDAGERHLDPRRRDHDEGRPARPRAVRPLRPRAAGDHRRRAAVRERLGQAPQRPPPSSTTTGDCRRRWRAPRRA